MREYVKKFIESMPKYQDSPSALPTESDQDPGPVTHYEPFTASQYTPDPGPQTRDQPSSQHEN